MQPQGQRASAEPPPSQVYPALPFALSGFGAVVRPCAEAFQEPSPSDAGYSPSFCVSTPSGLDLSGREEGQRRPCIGGYLCSPAAALDPPAPVAAPPLAEAGAGRAYGLACGSGSSSSGGYGGAGVLAAERGQARDSEHGSRVRRELPEFNTRVWHFSPRQGDFARPRCSPQLDPAVCEVIPVPGGVTTLAYYLACKDPSLRIGVLVASNSGRPGGACGGIGRVESVHSHHGTQEEDVVSNWLLTEAGYDYQKQCALYVTTIYKQWGMETVNSQSPETLQGVNYITTEDPRDFGDVWLVRDAVVSLKTKDRRYEHDKQARCTLAFVAGPNAGCSGLPTGSTRRTRNQKASKPHEYEFFRECISKALAAALDALITDGVDVALIARISCGIYAGPHRPRIDEDFPEVVKQLLLEPAGNTRIERARYFKRVIIPMLA